MSFGQVIIVDDHPIFLNGLKQCLETAGIKVLAAINDGRSVLEAIDRLRPDLVILDISMPHINGLSLAQSIQEGSLGTKVVFLSMYCRPGFIARAKQLRVDGYVLKDKPMARIIYAVKQVLGGGVFFDEEIERGFNQTVTPLMLNLSRLTATEKKILRRMGDGRSMEEIAEDFMISRRTVEKHRENINRKIDLKFTEKSELRRWAIEHRFLLDAI